MHSAPGNLRPKQSAHAILHLHSLLARIRPLLAVMGNCWCHVQRFLTAYALLAMGCGTWQMLTASAAVLQWMLSLMSEAPGQGYCHKLVTTASWY